MHMSSGARKITPSGVAPEPIWPRSHRHCRSISRALCRCHLDQRRTKCLSRPLRSDSESNWESGQRADNTPSPARARVPKSPNLESEKSWPRAASWPRRRGTAVGRTQSSPESESEKAVALDSEQSRVEHELADVGPRERCPLVPDAAVGLLVDLQRVLFVYHLRATSTKGNALTMSIKGIEGRQNTTCNTKC